MINVVLINLVLNDVFVYVYKGKFTQFLTAS